MYKIIKQVSRNFKAFISPRLHSLEKKTIPKKLYTFGNIKLTFIILMTQIINRMEFQELDLFNIKNIGMQLMLEILKHLY